LLRSCESLATQPFACPLPLLERRIGMRKEVRILLPAADTVPRLLRLLRQLPLQARLANRLEVELILDRPSQLAVAWRALRIWRRRHRNGSEPDLVIVGTAVVPPAWRDRWQSRLRWRLGPGPLPTDIVLVIPTPFAERARHLGLQVDAFGRLL